jgi:hypothetical protein
MWPLTQLGVNDQAAFAIALLIVLIGIPVLYARGARRDAAHHALAQPPQPYPVAGWYPDPTGQHRMRYWTGNGWSDRVVDHPRP